MSWLYESRWVPSEINGQIRCVRWFGRWSVVVSGAGQASSYLDSLWRTVLRCIEAEPASIRRILVLGFGTGGAIPQFRRRFSKAHLVTVEIDPVMVRLAGELQMLRKHDWPEMHIGNALDVLPKLTGHFDLIVCDMFLGRDVAAVTTQYGVMNEIQRLLDPQGHLLVNAYAQPDVLDAYQALFARAARWKHIANWIGYFRTHQAGVLGDHWPEDFTSFMSCSAYLEREYGNRSGFSVVHAGEAWGIRQCLGPLCIERSYGQQRPIPPIGPLRLHIWDSFSLKQPPKGWRTFPGAPWRRRTGYAVIPPHGDIHLEWSELAKRERKKWKTQTTWEIIEVDVETYCRFYDRCGKSRSLIQLFSAAVRRKAIRHGERLHLYGAVRRGTMDLIAGLAVLDIPEICGSIHVTGFILDAARHSPANVGLITHWFETSQSRGIRFCDFDGFYTKGEPTSWKGFSRFKSQFGTRFIAYQPAFWRLTRG